MIDHDPVAFELQVRCVTSNLTGRSALGWEGFEKERTHRNS